MTPAAWEFEDGEPDDATIGGSGRQAAPLVSLHFMRAALYRQRKVWIAFSLVGLLLSTAFLMLVPRPHIATTTLVLAHNPAADASQAMATDVSLATTQSVANDVINKLGLPQTPLGFLKSVTATALSNDLLEITLKAGSDQEAVRRLNAYQQAYLLFRNDEVSTQSKLLATGVNQRIDKITEQLNAINARLKQLSATQGGDTNDLLSQQTQLQQQLSSLQQQVEQSEVQTTAVIFGSRVIDVAAAETSAGRKRAAFTVASGLIGGTGLGIALVLGVAITSDRLRRRVEVATALGVPVRLSVGRLTPVLAPLRRLPLFASRQARRDEHLMQFAQAIATSMPGPGSGRWLGIGCVDNADEVRFGVAAAGDLLERRGRRVRLIDMTRQGGLEQAVAATGGSDTWRRPSVSRPRVLPSLLERIGDLETVGEDQPGIAGLQPDDLFIIMADLDPSVGAEYLSKWAQRVVVVVSAGRSSAERVRSAADTVRSAGLELHSALLLDVERRDESAASPIPEPPPSGGAGPL